jgi:hypothetical protein
MLEADGQPDKKRLRSSAIHEHTEAGDQPDTSAYLILDHIDARSSLWSILDPVDEMDIGQERHWGFGEWSLVDIADESDTGQERKWEFGDCGPDITADRMAQIIEHEMQQTESFQKDSDELPSTVEPRRPEGVPEARFGDNGNARAVHSAPSRLHGIRHH